MHKAQFFFFFWERLIPGIEPWTFCIGWNLLIIERGPDILFSADFLEFPFPVIRALTSDFIGSKIVILFSVFNWPL